MEDYNGIGACGVLGLAGVVGVWGGLEILEVEVWGIRGFAKGIEGVFGQILPTLCTLYLE